MARPRHPLCNPQTAKELEKRLESEPAGWRRERLLAVQMGLKNEGTLDQIAAALARSRGTIQTWFALMRRGGLERLLQDQREKNHGPKSPLDDAARAILLVELERGVFRSAPQILAWVQKQFGIAACQSTVYGWLRQLKARPLVPRPSHIKKKTLTPPRSKRS